MKYLFSILLGITLTAFAGLLVAHAQDYAPLAPLPGTFTGPTGAETTNLSLYLSGMLKLLIALGAMFSILVAVIGGTQYIASGIAPSAKQDAKDRILNALIGLTLVLTSYLILNSINPKLVAFNFMLPPIGTSPMATTTPITPPTTQPWPNDAAERTQLAGIGVNHPTGCTYIGEPACTSLAGLGSGAINGLIALKNSCTGCSITINGGTEYWLHGNRSVDLALNTTGHRPGGNVVDLSIGNTTLNSYIQNTGIIITAGCSIGTRYKIGTSIYVNEVIPGNPPHWHVCY